MVIYFADRRMNILGMASTELMEGFTVSDDLKSEDTDTGVATFECTIHWTNESRAIAEAATTAGNYLLRSNSGENEFYTIIETEVDTKTQSISIYAEDAGMDLLNETVGAFEADEAHPAAWYVEKYAMDTGFEIGINEISNLSRKLVWTGEATAAERIASVATQFDNAEISYTFDIQGLTITHKYINIHKKRGKDAGVQLRLNRDVDRIITTTSVADLATALYVTGGTPEEEEDPITLEGYEYDDGDMYVEEGLLKSREALKVWSRYVWAKEPNQIEGYTGHIVKQWSYDTTSQSELCNRAITQLGKVCEPAVNYEIDIQMLPENVGIGDYVDIVDEKGELYLSSRILKLTTSVCDQKQTATLGEFLIQESGISQTVKELAEQFSQLAKSRQYYVWIVYADDAEGDGISLDPTGKSYMGTCTTSAGPDPDLSDPTIYKWSLIQGEDGTGIEEIIYWYGKSDSPEEVPTVWQEEPYELLHNEYQWSYVETIYNNGVVELTTPHIIAYYDYLAVDELEARVATIEEAYVSYEEVELLVADDVEAAIINAGFLTADSALILDLTAFSESVYTLLGGEGSFGELQSVHLSSDNAVIDEAVIVNAIAGTVLADIINSNIIYTDQITIMSEDGGIVLAGTTMQFSDESGTVRLQLGEDADGNFTFVLYDETGEGIMIDSEGIHASAVPDGLIVNDMVADDAAISGWKLDIASVAQCLTEDGTLELSAAQVTINDTTLDAWYTDVTQTLEGIEGLTSEGLMNVEPWFCLWDENTPPDDEDLTPAICGEAVCGRTVCGMTDGELWVDHDVETTDGLYKWVKWKGYYADGHTEWSIPYCLTDGYLRTETSVLQTQLEVVQGEITAKVWMTDIEEGLDVAITDLWSEIDVTLDGIKAEVGSLSTDTVVNSTAYFCLWHSSTEAPPDDGDITEAICGVAICGMAYCGVTDGNFWSTNEPADSEGEYKWIRYKLEFVDGHTEWQQPYCLTDDFSREQLEAMYDNYTVLTSRVAQIEVTTDSITSTVYYVQQTMSDLSSSVDMRFSEVEQTMDGITSTVVNVQESMEGMENEISGAYTQIEQLADSVSIQIGDLQGEISASLVLQLDESTGVATLAAGADVIELSSGQLIINSGNFTLDASGAIGASSGTIGGWNIGVKSLFSGSDSLDSDAIGTYIGTDGIKQYHSETAFTSIIDGYLETAGMHVYSVNDLAPFDLYMGSSPTSTVSNYGLYIKSGSTKIEGSTTITFAVGSWITSQPFALEIMRPYDRGNDLTQVYGYIGFEDNAEILGVSSGEERLVCYLGSEEIILMSGYANSATANWNGMRSSALILDTSAAFHYPNAPQVKIINTGSSGDAYCTVTQFNDVTVSFGVGGGGYNRGIYDHYTESWMVYADSSNIVHIRSSTSGGWTKCGGQVTREFAGVTPASLSAPPEGYRPASEAYYLIWGYNGSGWYPVALQLSQNNYYAVYYYPSYGGSASDISNSSSWQLYGAVCYYCN